jgi:hypothetical protein
MSSVIGWTDCYSGNYPVVTFTEDRKKALVERIKKRKYVFNHQDHCFLPYCCPVYGDKVTCELNKAQWDSVMAEAYKDVPFGPRLLPQDAIDDKPVAGTLYEKKKFYEEGVEGNGG